MSDRWYEKVEPVTSFEEIERQLKRAQFGRRAKEFVGDKPDGETDSEGNPTKPDSLVVGNAKAIAVQGGAMVVGPLANALGYHDFADDVSRVNQAVSGAIGQRDDETIIPNAVMRAGRGVLSQLPPMVVSGAAGRLGPMALGAGSEASQANTEARDAGMSDADRAKYVAKKFVNEFGTTYAFSKAGLGGVEDAAASIGARRAVGQAMKEGGEEIGKMTVLDIAKRAVMTILHEIPEELTVERIHAALEVEAGTDPGAEDPAALLDRAIDTVLQAAGMGGVLGTMQGIGEYRNQPDGREVGPDPAKTDQQSPSGPVSDDVVSKVESILADGKPRTAGEIMQEFADQGGSMADMGGIMSHLDRQVGKGLVEGTDDGKFYVVGDESDTESDDGSPGETKPVPEIGSDEEYSALNTRMLQLQTEMYEASEEDLPAKESELEDVQRRMGEWVENRKNPNPEADQEPDTVSEEADLLEISKGLTGTFDEQKAAGIAALEGLAKKYAPDTMSDSLPPEQQSLPPEQVTTPKPLADMTPEEVEARWRKALPGATRRAPSRSEMIEQIEGVDATIEPNLDESDPAPQVDLDAVPGDMVESEPETESKPTQRILDAAASQIEVKPGAIVSVAKLRDTIGEGMDQQQFVDAMTELEQQGVIDITEHPDPNTLSESERAKRFPFRNGLSDMVVFRDQTFQPKPDTAATSTKAGMGKPAKPAQAIPGGVTNMLKNRSTLEKNVIIENPAGGFGFVGSVSSELLWEKASGEPVTPGELSQIAEANSFGQRFGNKKASDLGIRQRTYNTREAAEAALVSIESKPDTVSVPEVKTIQDIEALPQFSVYRRAYLGDAGDTGPFRVRGDGPRGGGDTIHSTLEEAKAQAERDRTTAGEQKDFKDKLAADEVAVADKDAETVASYKGFLTGSPMNIGKIRKALEKPIRYKGNVTTRKGMVDALIAEGRTVVGEGDDKRIESPDGSFFDARDVTATGLRYAEHLIAQSKPTTEPAPKPKVEMGKPELVETLPETPIKIGDHVRVDGTDITGSVGTIQTGRGVLIQHFDGGSSWYPQDKVRTMERQPDFVDDLVGKLGGKPAAKPDTVSAPWKDAAIEDEQRWFGTRVRVTAKRKTEDSFDGSVERVLNGGSVIEVKRDGNDFSTRVNADLVSVLSVVDAKPDTAAASKDNFWGMEDALQAAGFRFVGTSESAGAIQSGSATFPTFIAANGVRIGLSTGNNIYFNPQKRSVMVSSSPPPKNMVIVEAIVNREADRGKGMASEALRSFLDVADKQGVDIKAEVAQMSHMSLKGARSKSELMDWYKRHGFEPESDAAGNPIVVRKPAAKPDTVSSDADLEAMIEAEFDSQLAAKKPAKAKMGEGQASEPTRTKKERDSVSRLRNAIEGVIRVSKEPENRTRRKYIDNDISTINVHAGRLGIEVPKRSTYYSQGSDIELAQAVLKELDKKYPPKPSPTPKPKKTLEERKAASAKKVADLAEQLKRELDGLTQSVGANPRLGTIAVKYAIAQVEDGALTFAVFAKRVWGEFSVPQIEQLKPYLEMAWKVAHKRGVAQDEAGNLNDYKPKGVNDEKDGASQEADNKAGGVAGVGGSAGQSPADAPAKTGVDAEDGIPGRGTPVAGPTILHGDGKGEGSDAGNDGRPDQGDSSAADDSGNQSELVGGKPPGRRGGKNAGGVQGKDSGRNHVIAPGSTLAVPSEAKSFEANVAAIKLLKKLESEDRDATKAEKEVLEKFTGWGGLSNTFNATARKNSEYRWANQADLNWKKQWGDRYDAVKELLTEEEWQAAAMTTINAHYTSRDAIESMWSIAEWMGFKGGRVVELGSGIGHFAGLIPASVRDSSQFTMVEMDPISSRITQKLYPEAEVLAGDLNDIQIQPGKATLATGNVPFFQGGQPNSMARYGIELNLHNYFIARMIDALAPGGIGVVLTSNGTMDNRPDQRRFLAGRADFLGAIRLPNTAFKGNAKTDVVTDILIFRKLDGDAKIGQDIRDTVQVKFPNLKGEPVEQRINEYFHKNPEMVLGTHSSAGKLYTGDTYTVLPIEGADIKSQIETAMEKIPKPKSIAETDAGSTLVDSTVKLREGHMEIVNGKPTVAIGGERVAIGDGVKREGYPANLFAKTAVGRAVDYISLRDSYANLRGIMVDQSSTDEQIKSAQKGLNAAFDKFVKEHGHFDQTNAKTLKRDPGFYAVASLEVTSHVLNPVTDIIEPIYGKANVFTKRTMGVPNVPKSADTVSDAVSISLNTRGKIDIDYVSELTGKSADEARTELVEAGIVFVDPVSQQVEMRDQYLSGNVKQKLADAKVALEADPAYQKNVDELTKVIPEDKLIQQISFKLGDPWIDSDIIQSFAKKIFQNRNTEVKFSEQADSWLVIANVDGAVDAELGGTPRLSIDKVLEKTLNLKPVTVFDQVQDGFTAAGNPRMISVPNATATAAAMRAQRELQNSFKRFMKENDQQKTALEKNFNDKMNTSIATSFDGRHLDLPGKATSIKMRSYQLNAIWRIIKTGRVMLAHTVGAGKTYTMIGAAMELKRLGLANRSLLVVQNATLGQFATSFLNMYPNSKVLVARTEDLTKENRQLFLSRMTSEDWDAIVMAQSTYENLAPSIESESKFLNRRLDELEMSIADETRKSGKKSPTVKQLQKNKAALAKRIKAIQDAAASKRESNTVDFDNLDVDAIFLDEAHAYKKPFFMTKLMNLVGLNKEASGRGISTQVKLDTIRAKTGGRNIVLATGTPITNTLGEAYHMMSFLAPDINEQFGVETFDRFVGAFANVEPTMVQNAGGTMVSKDAIADFRNGDALMQYLYSAWDVFSPDMLRSYMIENPGKDGSSGLPEIKGGKPETVIVDRPDGVAHFMNYILDVYRAYGELKGEDKRTYSWIPVVLTGASKAAAMDLRLIYPKSKPESGGKVDSAAEVILRDYKESMDIKGTQLVFSDIRNPRTMEKLESFMQGEQAVFEEDTIEDGASGNDSAVNEEARNFLFDQITARLVAGGIPRSQIAYITDAKTATQRDRLFEKVNSGQIRVLMGSTSKMGIGVNVQERIVAVHELDAVYVPADSEQRWGRAIRFGNMNKQVAIYRYAMKDTFDGTVFAASLRKAKFIWQALSGKAGNEFEDPSSEATVSLEEAIAAISGSPLPAEKFKLQGKLRDMRSEEESFAIAKDRAERSLRNSEDRIEDLTKKALPRNRDRVNEFNSIAESTGLDKPLLVVNDKKITDPKEIDAFFAKAHKAMQEQFAKDTAKMKDRRAAEYGQDLRSTEVWLNGLNVWLGFDRLSAWTDVPKGAEPKEGVVREAEISARISLPSEPNLNLYFGSAKTGTGIFDAINRVRDKMTEAVLANEENVKKEQVNIESFKRQIEKKWDGADAANAIEKRLAEIETELLAAGSMVGRFVPTKPVVVDISDAASGDTVPEGSPRGIPMGSPGRARIGGNARKGSDVKKVDNLRPDPLAPQSGNQIDKFLSPSLQKTQSMGAAKQVVKSAEDLVENYDNGPTDGSPNPYVFSDPETQRRWETAMKGLTPRSMWQRIKDFAVSIKKNTVRGAMAELPRTEENADARAFLREFRDASHMAAWAVNSLLSKTVRPLKGHDMSLFTQVVVLRDLKGREGFKPFGLTQEKVESELKRFEGMLSSNPRVSAALDYRTQWFDAVKSDYIEAHRKLGIDMTSKLKNEDYFRHQVLQYYMINQGISEGGAGRKAQVAMGRNYLKRAKGSELDINANYIQAEWEVASQMIADTKRAQVLHDLERRYNIRDRLKNEAKAKNYEALAGGKAKVKRIQKLREERAEAQAKGDKPKAAAAIAELKKIDPLYEFRKKIAMNSGRLMKAEPYLRFVDTGSFFKLARDIAVDPTHKSSEIANALLASVNAQSQFIENALGSKFLTWEQLIPEGYSVVTLRPGNVMFAAYTVPERLANELLSEYVERLDITKDDLTKATVMGPQYTPIVVPNDVASQMERMSEQKGDSFAVHMDSMVVGVVRKWKGFVLLGPHRVAKYNLRGLSELDKVLALNPSAAKPALLWRSAKELYDVFNGNDDISPDVQDWMDLGGASTLPIVNDVMSLGSEKEFRKFFDDKMNASSLVTKPWKWYWKKAANISNYRESILRYSAYLAYLEQIQKNGKPNNYGGSNPNEIKGISDPKQKAFRLSADLLGDYGDLSPVGQWMRDRPIPFWAFQETNFRAYFNGVRNLARDERLAGKTGMKLAKEMGLMAITRSPWLAIRLGRVSILMAGAQAAMHAWNYFMFPDEEEELPEDVKRRPHLVFGRRADGSVIYFDRIGTSSDILDWFGFDTIDSDVRDILNNRKTIGELAKDMVASPLNKLIQGVSPIAKLPMGLITGKDTFPDFRKPRTIRDKGEYVAKAFGVDAEYRWLAGMPTRGLGDAAWRQFVYIAEPGSGDYYGTLDLKFKWGENNGAGGRGSFESTKSDAMRNYKQAIRYKDKIAAEKYMKEYFAAGGTDKGMELSIAYLHPLSGLSLPKEIRFLSTLTDSEMDQLKKAEKFAYEALMTPEQAEAVKEKRAKRIVDAAKTSILNSGRPNPKTNSDYESAIVEYESEKAEIDEWLKENIDLPDVRKAALEVIRSDQFKSTINAVPSPLKVGKEPGRAFLDRKREVHQRKSDALKWRSLIVD